MWCWLQRLHYWQDLAGAVIGGTLGVIGALIVARSAINRERRNASRMLQRDLLNVTGMVFGLTYHRRVTLATLGGDNLATNLAFYRHQLSPLFEAQMVSIIGTDTVLAGLLIGFHQAYTALDSHMRQIERPPANDPGAVRARRAIPRVLNFADEYARAALYLLPLQELGTWRRMWERLRRRYRPTPQDEANQALVARMSSEHPESDDTTGAPE